MFYHDRVDSSYSYKGRSKPRTIHGIPIEEVEYYYRTVLKDLYDEDMKLLYTSPSKETQPRKSKPLTPREEAL